MTYLRIERADPAPVNRVEERQIPPETRKVKHARITAGRDSHRTTRICALFRRDPQVDRYSTQEHRKEALQFPSRQAHCELSPEVRANEETQAYQQPGLHIDIAVAVVLPDAEEAHWQQECCKRSAACPVRGEFGNDDEERHNDDPAPYPKKTGEYSRDRSEQYVFHIFLNV